MNKIFPISKHLIKSFIWRFAQILSKQGTLFLLAIFSAKFLKTEEFGKFSYYLSFILLLAFVSDFGFSTAISKFVAGYNKKSKNQINKIILCSIISILAISLIIISMILIAGIFFKINNIIFYLSPLILLISLTSVFDGIYRGLGKFKILFKIAIKSSAITLFPFIFLIIKFGIYGLAVGYIIFYLIMAFLSTFSYLKEYKKYGPLSLDKKLTKNLLHYSFHLGIASLSYFFFSRIAILLAGYFNYFGGVSLLELVYRFESMLILPFFIIAHIIGPNNASSRKTNKGFKFFKKWKYHAVLISLISGLIFYIGSYLAINLFFKEYLIENTNLILIIFSSIFIIKSYAVVIDQGMIIPSGYGDLMSYRYLSIAIFNIVLSLIFLRLIGFIGIVISILISHVVMVLWVQIKFYSINRRPKQI
jgi:O-antigen/teichoic acid export membrane protein